MKNTQKKLKAKHFRYLTQEYIDDPMKYLIEFFESETSIPDWLADLNMLINAASNAKMNPPRSSIGYLTKKLIQQVELAYVIFRKFKLKTMEQPLKFNKRVLDHWSQLLATDSSARNIDTAADSISLFFSYQTLQQWYSILDDLWISLGDRDNGFLGNNGHEILAVKEFLLRLAASLGKIYENKILPNDIIVNQEDIENEEHQNQQTLLDDIDTIEKLTDALTKEEILYPKEHIILPHWLSPQPYSISALRDFFDKDDLNGWREDIRYWYQTVIDEKEFWSADHENSKFSGANLLFNYACLYSLLEMLSNESEEYPILPMRIDNSFSILPECQSVLIRHAKEEIILYYVSNEELDNPLSALLATVKTYDQQEWNEILYEWINYGLAKNRYTGAYSDYSTRIYQTMIKIIELAYLTAFSEEIESLNQKQTALLETEI
ncbi:hypothetical protein [Sphingobacterium siyangense]|uniref:hypothetical protein n=1 Tax=Sphingobacterium siyangense TaxID=459529 RepID=UPI002FD89F62